MFWGNQLEVVGADLSAGDDQCRAPVYWRAKPDAVVRHGRKRQTAREAKMKSADTSALRLGVAMYIGRKAAMPGPNR